MSAVTQNIVIDDTTNAIMGDRPYIIFIGNEIPGGSMNWGSYTNAVDNADVIRHLRAIADSLEEEL